ncbi:hypothetical protein ncot_04400 [Nocardioides sp. JQ2195]|uniref:hypothetical protein n=1 Tax=Nocardioides sp. JQ2195 TaxID=2592334 RepID=UPI00143ED02E|nr:hypothetical protein [Nocardioides sp. JQ2195]QIX25923.1 hypothetical protein ncot_04400 [Nocardioides sp. JQ2195]
MRSRPARVRSIGAGVCLAVAAVLPGTVGAAPPAGAAPTSAAAETTVRAAGAGEHNVTVRGPSRMRLRTGCREDYSIRVSFDVSAGEDYWVNLRGQDSQGHTIDGSTVSGTATATGRTTIERPLLLCGEGHDAGVGKLQVNVHVGDEMVDGTARTVIRYADRVRMKKPKRAVGRGHQVVLRGRWDRGTGFGLDCGYHNRKFVRVRIDFKPEGGSWRQIARTRIGAYGDWRKKVEVRRTGRYRARVRKSDRYLPARSVARRVRVR